MQLINGASFLDDTALFYFYSFFFFALFGAPTVISPFTTIYASHKSDLNIDVLILISLLTSKFPSD